MGIDLVRDLNTLEPNTIDPRCFGCHTAILAQSGSGKSFMVGRLIEELLLKTKARVVVLDPNSDFVRLPEIEPGVWNQSKMQKWFFPGEEQKQFASSWSAIKITVLTNRNLPNAHPLRINWGGLTDSERADVMDINPISQPELYWLSILTSEISRSRWDEFTEPDYDFEHFRCVADEICEFLLGGNAAKDISHNQLAQSLRPIGVHLALRFRALISSLENFDIWRSTGEDEKDIAEIIQLEPEHPSTTIIDLLSVGSEAERIALTTRVLTTLWQNARDGYGSALRSKGKPDRRTPTILVIDEAHNIVPALRKSPASERLAGEVVRIAAEGRKFGLFLIVITQRPRKLEASILSECDALLLMKMTNGGDLAYASEIFGFMPNSGLIQANELKVGDVFLHGRLAGGGKVWHVAPRRTMEGGKSLDDAYWTKPY